jgi:hypothetical protein
VSATVKELEERLFALEKKMDENTAMTKQMVDAFETLKAGIKVLGVLGKVAAWLTPIVTLIAAIVALVHGKK